MQVKARGVLASVFPGGAMVMTNAHAGDSEDMASIPGADLRQFGKRIK